MSTRLDGATRGDRAEATALAIGGLTLVLMPGVALLDQMGSVWLWLSFAAAVAGALIGGLGIRWFLVDGPILSASALDETPTTTRRTTPELPMQVRLMDASHRLVAHVIRYLAFGGALLLLLFEPAFLDGLVRGGTIVGLFLTSVVADQVLLRPRRYVLDSDGIHPRGRLGRQSVRWDDVKALYWRNYPGKTQPPYPSGERIIIELENGTDTEFVFHRKKNGTEADQIVQATNRLLGHRLRVLRPRETDEQPSINSTSDAG